MPYLSLSSWVHLSLCRIQKERAPPQHILLLVSSSTPLRLQIQSDLLQQVAQVTLMVLIRLEHAPSKADFLLLGLPHASVVPKLAFYTL